VNAEKPATKIDSLLEPLLLTASDEQADEFLLRLIAVHVEAVVKGIIRYKLHFRSQHATERAEADDIHQEVLMQLLAELRQLRHQPEAYPIADVRGLAATIAHRACSRWMRRRFPERHAFKNRLHYLLTRQAGLAVWQNESGTRMAGFVLWRQETKAATAERLRQLSEDERMLAHIRSIKTGKQHELGGALAAIFNFIGSPVEFDELVNALAAVLQIRDQPLESTVQIEETIGLAAAGEVDTAWQVEKRTFLQRLWEEIRELPLNQRVALLLNLKDASGGGCIALFPATGVATIRQLAEVLDMTAEEFAALWKELPLEDARIAQILRLTRQQVINARKSARERLTRRLRGFM
jgi:DNA-directed RNA polymerase specialized sigma24 family protein